MLSLIFALIVFVGQGSMCSALMASCGQVRASLNVGSHKDPTNYREVSNMSRTWRATPHIKR